MWAEWADGEPDKKYLLDDLLRLPANCAYFTEEGLKDIYCTAPLKFVCERSEHFANIILQMQFVGVCLDRQ